VHGALHLRGQILDASDREIGRFEAVGKAAWHTMQRVNHIYDGPSAAKKPAESEADTPVREMVVYCGESAG
jgi:hypothetical protein